jgi:hypothetical protein
MQFFWEVYVGQEWSDDIDVLSAVRREKDEASKRMKEMAEVRDEGGDWRDIEWGQSENFLPEKNAATSLAAMAEKDFYLGSQSCAECHTQAHDVWVNSRHHHAYLSLVEQEEHHTTDCLTCHSTGMLEPGGYNPINHIEDLSPVGCENCHGPGAKHVAKWKGEIEIEGTGITRGNLDLCIRCHDDYNSPRFERNSYWEKIKH